MDFSIDPEIMIPPRSHTPWKGRDVNARAFILPRLKRNSPMRTLVIYRKLHLSFPVSYTRAICASVLRHIATTTTTTLTKIGQLRYEGGCSGRSIAALRAEVSWSGEAMENDDSLIRESEASPHKTDKTTSAITRYLALDQNVLFRSRSGESGMIANTYALFQRYEWK